MRESAGTRRALLAVEVPQKIDLTLNRVGRDCCGSDISNCALYCCIRQPGLGAPESVAWQRPALPQA